MTTPGGEPRRPVSSGTGSPPPRRPSPPASPAVPGGASTAALPDPRPTVVVQPADTGVSRESGSTNPPGRRTRRAATSTSAPEPGRPAPSSTQPSTARGPLWLRLTAWLLALPAGLVLVGVPARAAGYLSSQRLLDIVIDRDRDRYVPLVVVVVLWALVTAVLVQLMVEGGAWLLRRRRARARRARGAEITDA